MNLSISTLARWIATSGAILSATHVSAATYTATSCAQSAVQSSVTSAADGDTVVVPAGTCTWNSSVSISNKTITLKGAGSGTGGTKINHGGGDHSLVAVDAGAKTGKMDISGFWFAGKSSTYSGTAIKLDGPAGWKNLRVHDNIFDGNYPVSIQASAGTHGLIDHNLFKGSAAAIKFYGAGEKDWATPLTLGTADFFFVEDNTFDLDDSYGNIGWPTVDMYSGGRHVFRYNVVRNGLWETHDKARSGQVSANAYEVYNNKISSPTNKWKGMDVSSGTGVIWGNTFTGDYTVAIGAMDYKSSSNPRNVRPCDGTDPADQNVVGQAGWRCQYQIGSMGEGATAYGYPLYVWANTVNGTAATMKCTDGCNHVQANRDFVNSASAKTGYTPYTYPHPLQGGSQTPPSQDQAVLPAPTNLRVQ